MTFARLITRNPAPMAAPLPLVGRDEEFARFLELRKERKEKR